VRDIFDILIPVGLITVTVVLFMGLYALFKGGDYGRSWSNKMMRLRVLTQFCVIVILVGAIWWRTTH
jgi:hypothetical protein